MVANDRWSLRTGGRFKKVVFKTGVTNESKVSGYDHTVSYFSKKESSLRTFFWDFHKVY